MIQIIVNSEEMGNNFDKYFNMVINGYEVIITKNGKAVGRFMPEEQAVEYLTDSLSGVLSGSYDIGEVREERIVEKYKITML